MALRIGPNSVGPEEVVGGQREAQGGNRQQIADERVPVGRGLGDVRVEGVVLSRAAHVIHVGALLLHLVKKEIAVGLDDRGFEPVEVANRPQHGGTANRERPGIKQAARWAGGGSIGGVADHHAGRGAGDGDREIGMLEPSTVRREFQVVHERQGGAGVVGARRGGAEVMVGGGAEELVLDQLRQQEELGAAGGFVDAMQREDIAARAKQAQVARDINLFIRQGTRSGPGRGGHRVPCRGGRDVSAGDLRPVQVSGETVVVFHPQGQGGEGGGIGDREGGAHIG